MDICGHEEKSGKRAEGAYNDDDSEDNEEEKTCEMCHVGDRKYKCPRCFVLTCSLACCVKHKADTGCNGRRDRAAFVSMNEFSDKHIKNDFHFLEDVLQSKGRAQRTMNQINSDPGQNMNALKLLVRAARRHGTTLTLMHKGMQKRLMNTTKFNQKKDKIFWKIHFVFALSPEFESRDLLSLDLHITNDGRTLAHLSSRRGTDIAEGITSELSAPEVRGLSSSQMKGVVGATVDRVDEDKSIMDVLNSILEPQPGQDASIAYTLRRLRLNRDSLLCLIQQIPSPATDPVFSEVLLSQTIKEVLQGRTIIEYPTFVVSTADNLKGVRRMLTTLGEAANNGTSFNTSASKKAGLDGDYSIEEGSPNKRVRRGGGADGDDGLTTFSAAEVLLGRQADAVDSRLSDDDESSSEDEEEEVNNEGQGVDPAMETEFLESLKQLESADLAQLSAIISEEESKLLGNERL